MLGGTSTAMCCITFKPPAHVPGSGQAAKRLNRVHVKTPPSAKPCALASKPHVVVLSNNNDNLHGSWSNHESDLSPSGCIQRPLPSLSNRVGVMGGMSALSTLGFLQKLVQWSCADGGECPPFIVCSDPLLSRELSSPATIPIEPPQQWNRNDSLELNRALILENLRNRRVFLERSGARCIVLPCHISPAWQAEISEGCAVPFFHIGECVAQTLKAANLKPIEAGSTVRIGVLASDSDLAAQIYQKKLENQGLEVIMPDKATMEHTVIPAIQSLNRKDVEGARNLLRIAIQVLLVRAVNVIILASADMSTLLPKDDPLIKKCIDPMDALARATIQWAKEKKEKF